MMFPSEYEIQNWLKEQILCHLSLESNWIGDPATSVFGIEICLTWDGMRFSSTIVDFIGKTHD